MHSGSPSPKAIEIFSLVTWLYELFSFPLVLKLDTKKQSQTKRTQAGGKSRECLRIPWIKGEGHSKKLTFLSSPIASKHSLLPLAEFSRNSSWKIDILKLSWPQPYHVYVTSFGPTRNFGQGEKPETVATDFASFTRSAKSIFFSKRFSTSLSLMLSSACLAENMFQEQPGITQ